MPRVRNDAGNARQGQGGLEQGQQGQQENHVQHQGQVGDQTGGAVVQGHGQHHQHAADDHGSHALFDGVHPQGRTDGAVLKHLDGGRQGTGAQGDGQVGGFLFAEGTGDLGAAAGDALADHGRRIDGVIQNDGHAAADIGAGDAVEAFGPQGIEVQGDVGFVEARVDANLGVGNQIAGQHRLIVDHDGGLGHRAAAAIELPLVKQLGSRRQHAPRGFHGVNLLRHQLELQTGGFSKQGHGPFRILDAGQLHQNTVLALTLQDRFAQTELVDAVAQGFHRLAHGITLDGLHRPGAEAIALGNGAVHRFARLRFQIGIVRRQPLIDLSYRILFVSHNLQLRFTDALHPPNHQLAGLQLGLELPDQAVHPAFHGLFRLHPQHQVHPALQVETEVNGIKSFFPPGRKTIRNEGRRQRQQGQKQTARYHSPPHYNAFGHDGIKLLSHSNPALFDPGNQGSGSRRRGPKLPKPGAGIG